MRYFIFCSDPALCICKTAPIAAATGWMKLGGRKSSSTAKIIAIKPAMMAMVLTLSLIMSI
ncbi:MAG: hypothetical protein KKI06_10175 [Euryarchaeota archaeon]|nr:hypothetical protein [Euryarchaeota archaeon]